MVIQERIDSQAGKTENAADHPGSPEELGARCLTGEKKRKAGKNAQDHADNADHFARHPPPGKGERDTTHRLPATASLGAGSGFHGSRRNGGEWFTFLEKGETFHA